MDEMQTGMEGLLEFINQHRGAVDEISDNMVLNELLGMIGSVVVATIDNAMGNTGVVMMTMIEGLLENHHSMVLAALMRMAAVLGYLVANGVEMPDVIPDEVRFDMWLMEATHGEGQDE